MAANSLRVMGRFLSACSICFSRVGCTFYFHFLHRRETMPVGALIPTIDFVVVLVPGLQHARPGFALRLWADHEFRSLRILLAHIATILSPALMPLQSSSVSPTHVRCGGAVYC